MTTINIEAAGRGAKATIVRPNDTAAYAFGDVVGGAIKFANIAEPGRSFLITAASLEIDGARISGENVYTLHVYRAAPPSDFSDNEPFDLPAADRETYLGRIPLGFPILAGASARWEADGVNKQVHAPGRDLWAYLETGDIAATIGASGNTYIPAEGRTYRLSLHGAVL